MFSWKEWLINYAKRTPYLHIGNYMSRWWIVPYKHELKLKWYKNPFGWVLQQFDIAIRVHEILQSDSDRALHTHPWSYCTVILKGGYVEVTEKRNKNGVFIGHNKILYTEGSILFRKATFRHRLELMDVRTWLEHGKQVTTTLFITFKKTNDWGFYEDPDTFVYYKDYLEKLNNSER